MYLGNDTQESFAVLDAAPFVRKVTNELEQVLAQPAVVPKPIWAPKIGACEMCPWKSNCEDGRKQARDLSLVAKMRDEQRSRLMKSGITTIDSLAEAPDEKKPPFISKDTFARLRDQARLQLLQEKDSIVRHEVFQVRGFGFCPALLLEMFGLTWKEARSQNRHSELTICLVQSRLTLMLRYLLISGRTPLVKKKSI